jgi:hypothetical protein
LPISAADVIAPAFHHTKEQLLRPFRFTQWMRLALVGILAGETSSFNGCNFNYPLNSRHHAASHFLGGPWPAQLTDHPARFLAALAAALLGALALLLLFTYISSVMRFILFDSIVARECHIRQGWARRKRPGFHLFTWWILLMLLTFAALLVFVGIPAASAGFLVWFANPRDHVLGLVLGGILLLLLFLVIVAVMALIQVMTKDFVVPQMALEDISAMEGSRRLWLWLKHDKAGYAGYIGMKIVLAIGAGMALGIVSFIVLLALLIPIGGVGIVAVLAAKAAGWTWTWYNIALAVVAGSIVLAILIFVFSWIAVPVIVFFPAYSIYFFAPRYAQLAALLWPQPSAPMPPG